MNPFLQQASLKPPLASKRTVFLSNVSRKKENIIRINFENVKKNEKPLLKALIKIKAKNPEFDLEQTYNMNKPMFTKEKLLEKLFE
jgi:hypothetical protein